MNPRRIAPLLCVLALLSACGEEARPPAAVVAGEEISDAQVQRSIPLFEFLGGIQESGCGEPEPGERADAACARFVLYRLIEEKLVGDYLEERDLEVPSEEVDQTLESLEQQLGPRLEALMREHGVTDADVRSIIGRLLRFRVLEEELGEDQVSEEELREEYDRRLLELTNTIHAWHILVEEQKLAERIARQVTPENFAELARKHSTDPGSGPKGGDLGVVPASQFDQTFAEAALSLEPGEIGDPVKTQFGWHIIRLIEAEVATFEEARSYLLRQLAGDVLSEWLIERLEAVEIEVNPRYGRLDLENRRIAPIRSTATDGDAETESTPATPTQTGT